MGAGVGSPTIYCPFQSDGGTTDCDRGTQHCCEPSAGVSSCVAAGTACSSATGMDWQCQDPADCATGQECCATGSIAQNMAGGVPCPGDYFGSGMHAATCVAAGSCATVIICNAAGECPTGQTCTAFRKSGVQVGGCM